jgi:glucose/arabinose dehydrogenase
LATVNLALGELATQSSTAVGGVASRAVDGNTNGSWAGGSVTHTQAQASAWWEVDLGEVREIDDVALWNRTDCCGERLSNFYVMVGSLPGPAPGAPGVFTHFQAAQAGSPTTVAVHRLGRYVRIQKAGSGVIALAEVQVLGRAVTGPLNLALGRPTSQSSTAAGGVSSRAVDGDSDGAYASASVTHTGGGVGSWWEVDLGAPRQIATIDIWNRTDCCADRLSNYTVLVSFHPGPEPGDPNVFEHFESAQAGRPTTIPVGQLGRYVRIQKSGPGVVALAEVEVFGGAAAVANAALGRAASQSSTAAGGVASRAVDGQVDGAWGAGSVTHTFVNTPAWWEVDLGGAVAVEWVDIWNRTDCCGDRLSQYHVLLSNDPAPQPGDPGIFEHFESAQADSPTTVLVGQSGRYLRVQKASGVVSLAEVQVWASTGSAAYVGQEISPVLTTAESFRASIRLRNTSAVAWSAAGGFALASQSPPDNATWGVSEIAFAPAESVAPGTEKTFTFDIVAPNQSGDYVFQWQLRRDDQWIGEPSPPVTVAVVAPPSASPYSLRFRGNGSQDIDRVKIRLDDPSDSNDTGPPADVGSDDFTLEFWMKASAADNTAPAQTCGDNINWINGNIIVDRDRFNQGRKFGVSIAGGVIIFGVTGDGSGGGANDRTICGTTSVVDDEWHHVAAQRRRSDGQLWLYVDGQLEADADGPDGDVSYPDDGVPCANCCGGSSCDFSDPFLVVGAEKHDADNSNHPSFDGFFDEMRLSDELRYASPFTPPTGPFTPDTGTVALYHFDEGNGDLIVDASGAASGPSPGELRFGGAPAGPLWSIDTPFPAAPTVTFAAVVTAPSRVVAMANAGDHRLFLVTQAGQILIFDGAQILATPFLDIDPLVAPGEGERGLLGLAFHPEYTANGYFYVNYTNNSGNTVVARYRRSTADPDLADPASAVTLLTVAQPAANHNGGQLKFGADGYLYIGLGDGGSGGDPSCFAQRGDTLLGKMLRVDVDQNTAVPPYYGIPPGNPFSGPGDPADEVWALGLRNPWRFTFDRLTGGLFIADVGQHAIEEVSFQAASSSGGENYGWKVMEGTGCYIVDCPGGAPNCNTNNCPGAMPACNHPSLVLPILEYSHALGCSITGGYVYRGRTDGELAGTYLYADFCSRRIWGGRNDGGAWTAPQLATAASNIFTFGQDAAGEMYVSTGTVILRIE